MEMLAGAGFRWIRMDFGWNETEREKGVYDFAAYDRLVAALDAHKLRAILILGYSNPHYDKGESPTSDQGRRAFARWAAAAAHRFRNRGVLWEMYNEPNACPNFWKVDRNEQYIKLALEVGKALREAEPGELYIGPALSGMIQDEDFSFLDACFKAGLLEYWSAVSVHPYRQDGPECVVPDYARTRRMIAQYAPKGKAVSILSGEWGYSSGARKYDEGTQGKYLPRQWLTNLANGVPLSIWYDWHDDGPDYKDPEHNFGTVHHAYLKGQTPVYQPKPAYLAAKTLTHVLDGYRFEKRLTVGGPDDYVMRFVRADEVRFVAWTTAAKPRMVVIPVARGRYTVTGHTGKRLPALTADEKGLRLTVADAPIYLVPATVPLKPRV
jgi:hypothetical protein